MIIILRFGENNVLCPKYFDIRIWISMGMRGRSWSTLHFLFIKKNGKSTWAWPILKSNSTSFWFKQFFPRMNKFFFKKRSPPISFSKVGFLKVQTHNKHSLSIATRRNKLCWHQQRLHNNLYNEYLKEENYYYDIYN